MSIDGVNTSKDVKMLDAGNGPNVQADSKNEKMGCVFSEPKTSLAATVNQNAKDINLPEQVDSMPTLTRKEAEHWIKICISEYGLSQKEAKLAFEQYFGYKFPEGNAYKNAKKILKETNHLVGYIPSNAIENTDEKGQLTRKESKTWIKDYMAKNQCSKKEAKAAFKESFGYEVPDSKFLQGLRTGLLTSGIVGLAFGLSHSAEDRENFVKTGKWNPES